jgi:hypothetical protein
VDDSLKLKELNYKAMKRILIIGICAAGLFAASSMLQAQTNSEPPVESPIFENAAEPAMASAKITTTGIMSIFGSPEVIFKVTEPSGSSEKEYVLSEKQRRGEIEVVAINLTNGMVIFNNHGVRQEIPLPHASVFGTGTPDADGLPVSSPHPDIPRPGGLGSGTPSYLGGDQNTGQSSQPPLAPDQQILMIEAQRAYYKSKGDPESLRLANSLPPTAMSPENAYELPSDNSAPASATHN